ncbi:MAG: cation-transporting P-type ATPase, partial [Actinobacteria bacterium]|nr:cation-transporting P-type ATPase [Actinomycetota bacterium]
MTVLEDPVRRSAGLTRVEAAQRLARDGRNELPPPKRTPLVLQFLRELGHFFALMLWVASVLAWVADLPQLAIAIAAVVLVNATFAFVQERRSDRAAQRLRALLPRRVIVQRDGEPCEIDAAEIVVGDLMLLSSGDRVCADGDVVVNRGLRVDASMLTGESESVGAEVHGRVSAGTFVVDGEADVEVVATGRATRLAQISTLTNETHRPRRPLTTELDRVVRTISIIAVGVGLTFMVVSMLLGTDHSDAIVFAIGVTVALVPEGLLPTVTLSLAIGAQRMAKQQALVRHLDAVETLGSTTFICTDKTGTLTENRMTATQLWTPSASATIDGLGYVSTATITCDSDDRTALVELARAAARCGTGRAIERDGDWVSLGDPMEAALDACARRLGLDLDADRRARPEVARFPFDSGRKRMSTVVGGSSLVVVAKGAVEGVLALCADDDASTACRRRASELTDAGLRVIAVAARRVPEGVPAPASAADAERELELLGLVGLLDPPRVDAGEALDRCRGAGIKVAMITGDHPQTALAIA